MGIIFGVVYCPKKGNTKLSNLVAMKSVPLIQGERLYLKTTWGEGQAWIWLQEVSNSRRFNKKEKMKQ